MLLLWYPEILVAHRKNSSISWTSASASVGEWRRSTTGQAIFKEHPETFWLGSAKCRGERRRFTRGTQWESPPKKNRPLEPIFLFPKR